jgi:hypothetical protein
VPHWGPNLIRPQGASWWLSSPGREQMPPNGHSTMSFSEVKRQILAELDQLRVTKHPGLPGLVLHHLVRTLGTASVVKRALSMPTLSKRYCPRSSLAAPMC